METIDKEIKEYKSLNREEKDRYLFAIWIVLIPAILYFMDRYNIFEKLKLTENITTNYDWLSFLGTYLGTIISMIFLIIVTKDDRKENTRIIQKSQRPTLCTNIFQPYSSRMTDKSVEGYMYIEEKKINTSEYFVVEISNCGQTVAILDMEKSYIMFNCIDVSENATIDKKQKDNYKKVFLKKYLDRVYIDSGKTAKIILIDKSIKERTKKIDKVYIEYTDLFKMKYNDYIEIKDGQVKVLEDNVEFRNNSL
jgi:hypothetical protein